MKNIDFSFFTGGDDDPFKLPGPSAQDLSAEVAREVARIREQHLRVALIEVNGSFPAVEEIQRRGRIEQSIDGSQMVLWDGKPLLYFGPVTFAKTEGNPHQVSMVAKFLYV